MSEERDYIPRRLSWTGPDLKLETIGEDEIAARFSEPVVILGDPGMGKTWLMEKLGEADGNHFLRAAQLLRQPDGADFGNQRLVIDGLDEVAAIKEGDPLHKILTKLIACGKPPFILSCRSAEWNGISARLDIADEYGAAPRCLDLELLTEEEAVAALGKRTDEGRARQAIYALKSAGLKEFFQNPLYLDFVAAILGADKELPTTRAGLYELAVAQLRLERNPRQKGRGVDTLSEDSALDAAGAIMAAMLVTGATSVLQSGQGKELKLTELSGVADPDAMKAILGSNLFRKSPGVEGAFIPLHRTVAEFLGARWLARHVDRHGNSKHIAGRIVGLIAAEGGVPSSLRGLHAWLPKFSPTKLGHGAIDRDPYGIIRYGDGDGLTAEQARRMIDALRRLSRFEPWFRDNFWANEAMGGLAQAPLLEDIRKIIMDEGETAAFRSLFLEALAAKTSTSRPVAEALLHELQAILFDANRAYIERRSAGEALTGLAEGVIDWSAALQRLLKSKSRDCHRLAVELLDDIGFAAISDDLIASIILAHSRLLQKRVRETRTFGSFFRLEREFPVERIVGVLDMLAAKIVPKLDPEKWWGDGYDERWSEFAGLVRKLCLRQLQHDASTVSPEQLHDWLKLVERQYQRNDAEVQGIAEILKADDRLRRGVQRLALTQQPGWRGISHLQRISSGFGVTDDDARLLLQEIVARNDPADRNSWLSLVSHFRVNNRIPIDIRKLARPYAKGDQELLDFLVKKPRRPKADDWELKHRRTMREREKRKAANTAKARKNYTENIEAIRQGEFRWIFAPAQAYLDMYSDLERRSPPEGRIEEWLGEDIRDAALEGFDAVLKRDDLPTADQIAQSYAESRVWNFIYPMLAGAGRRHLAGQGFDGLPADLVSALLLGCEETLLGEREQFDGLEDALRTHLQRDALAYEAHWRRKMEPMLQHKRTHVQGLYRFARQMDERPLSAILSRDWLERFTDMPLDMERELANCLVYAPNEGREEGLIALREIAKARLAAMSGNDERYRYWRGIQFGIDFDEGVVNLPGFTKANRDWLWHLTQTFYNRYEEREHHPPVTLEQLAWVVSNFRTLWPKEERPGGVTSGDDNPWDASDLIERLISRIARDPSPEAEAILRRLRDEQADGYLGTIQHAIASQHRSRLEANYQSPTLQSYKAVLSDTGEPQNAADLQAIILAELTFLQERLYGDAENVVNNFYTDAGKPRDENGCRDQLLIALGPNLPFGIQKPLEVAMPQGKRGDAAFVWRDIAVPLECKGQWHNDVWTAAETQLDRYYAIDHKAAGKGIYLVFWFGPDAPAGRRLKLPPGDMPKPVSAEEMRVALEGGLPESRRADIAIVVLDLTRPCPA